MPEPYFFDTSALMKRYVSERGTPRALDLTRPEAENPIYISRLTEVEMIASLRRLGKQGGPLTMEVSRQLVLEFRWDAGHQYLVLDLAPARMAEAADLAEKHALRGADAVQLAVALEAERESSANGFPPLTLISSDLELNTAALAEGLRVENPEQSV